MSVESFVFALWLSSTITIGRMRRNVLINDVLSNSLKSSEVSWNSVKLAKAPFSLKARRLSLFVDLRASKLITMIFKEPCTLSRLNPAPEMTSSRSNTLIRPLNKLFRCRWYGWLGSFKALAVCCKIDKEGTNHSTSLDLSLI